MGFLDILGNIVSEAMSRAATDYARTAQRAGRNLDIRATEMHTSSQKQSVLEKAEKMRETAEKMKTAASKMKELSTSKWDSKWVTIGSLMQADLSPYSHCVGLYRHKVGGKIMYLGRAIEWDNGGLRKRLSDYRRTNDSARQHTSGRIINEHLDEITTDVLVVGEDEEAAVLTRKLEFIYIGKYNPEWNKLGK